MGVLAVVMLSSAAVTPPAHADSFVQCNFSLTRPYIYSVEGADYVGIRIDASNCRTNLPSPPLTFVGAVTGSGLPPGNKSTSFEETRYVSDGDNFSVFFPNDDRLIPLVPGVYAAAGSIQTFLPGFRDIRDLAHQCATWQFQGATCGPIARG
ncbi:hypothetical protein CCUG62472_01762 [Mycobacteroides salmoniphilum]|uniref:Uncharacterized protein n=2 Tax=Mycobacteroides salmoniphilum TaxID=404941 RepID=A0A4R8SQV7_9MYCO|nr:hypothetical protein CCUG62472_01762 [Mycobacteroides salmoniphilum]TEA02126.1 hypothetical protein CCUG60884_03255 [Mycobacteroides salmoniphilum]